MKITVKYFALLREAVGLREETVEVPENTATVAELLQIVSSRQPDAFAALNRIRAAVNETMVPMGAEVGEGDVVAFFPPVTGG